MVKTRFRLGVDIYLAKLVAPHVQLPSNGHDEKLFFEVRMFEQVQRTKIAAGRLPLKLYTVMRFEKVGRKNSFFSSSKIPFEKLPQQSVNDAKDPGGIDLVLEKCRVRLLLFQTTRDLSMQLELASCQTSVKNLLFPNSDDPCVAQTRNCRYFEPTIRDSPKRTDLSTIVLDKTTYFRGAEPRLEFTTQLRVKQSIPTSVKMWFDTTPVVSQR